MIKAYSIILGLLLSSCATNVLELKRQYEAGVDLYNTKKYAEALPILEKLCARDYADSCDLVAKINEMGDRAWSEKKRKEVLDFIEKRLLGKSVFIEIGMSKGKVIEQFGLPTSVSSSKGFVVLHYDLYRQHDISSYTVPFIIKIKQAKVVSFGIDKEEEERRSALRQGKVSIQKEMGSSDDKSKNE